MVMIYEDPITRLVTVMTEEKMNDCLEEINARLFDGGRLDIHEYMELIGLGEWTILLKGGQLIGGYFSVLPYKRDGYANLLYHGEIDLL